MPIDFTDRERWIAVRDAIYAAAFAEHHGNNSTYARCNAMAQRAVDFFEDGRPEPAAHEVSEAEPEEDNDEPFVDAYRRWIDASDGALASGKVCEIIKENGIAPRCHVREIAGGYEFRFAVEPVPPRYAKRDVIFCVYTSGKATTGGPECSARADVRTLLASLGFGVKS